MTLLESLPPSYKQLITALETIVDEKTSYRIRDGMFDAWDVQQEGEWIIKWWSCNDVASRQIGQSTFTQKHQD